MFNGQPICNVPALKFSHFQINQEETNFFQFKGCSIIRTISKTILILNPEKELDLKQSKTKS